MTTMKEGQRAHRDLQAQVCSHNGTILPCVWVIGLLGNCCEVYHSIIALFEAGGSPA